MWVLAFLCLVAASSVQGNTENQPWKPNTVYKYTVEGLTLTALHQLSDQYSGMVMRAVVEVQAKSSNIISMQMKSAEYSDVHTNLSQGWSSPIPESQLHYQQIKLSKTPIELNYRKWMIRGMTVNKQMPTWELNLMKSLANQLQVDTRAENLIESRINSLPSKDSVNAVYKTMEESIGGLCETMYDISPLPKVVLINHPELAPLPHLQPDGQLIDIVKTRNFSNCDIPVEYHFGITGQTDWLPSSNQMGKFLARSSVSRVVISGSLDRYTIQSSVTTSKVIASPFLFNDQKGMVISQINMTLVNVESASNSPQSPINPKTVPNLVYQYDPASPDENKQWADKLRQWNKFEKYSIWQVGDDSSSSSNKYPSEKRFTRSATFENDRSTYDENKKSEPGQIPNPDSDTLKMSHKDWLMRFRPDIYDKIMTLQNNNKTAALVRDPLLASSSESSSSSTSSSEDQSPDTIHLSHKEWLKKFRPDIYNKIITSKNNTETSSLLSASFLFPSSDSSSSSSSSPVDSSNSNEGDLSVSWERFEEDNWHPDMSEAPHAPFLPMFIGNQGNSIQSAKEIKVMSAVHEIAREISHDIQNPSSIPGQMTLSKFSVLTQIVETMNVKQMSNAMKELYYPLSQVSISSSSDAEKHHAWIAFRDAVAQAGTGPALVTLKEMIESKKVQGEEAAQLVSVLPNSARFPNTEYMNIFFALITSSAVTEQNLLNTSAVISFTELARKAFVSKSSAYKRFPVHVYGPVMPKREQPVIQKYIPYFARGLKEAVKNADSNKIRTMITALGNLAHPRILSVFEPYLEGREPMSQFQRLTMVVALNRMAKVFPNVARPVLFRLYQNTGEASEVRVAAVFQIMKTNPPAQMLQRMAEFTNDDLDLQVVSAVQSAIRSAATLSSPSDHELMMNAQAAVELLSPKELPAQMSKKKVHSYWAKQLNLAYKQAISYIGSEDSFTPSNVFYSLRRDLGGFKRQTVGFSAMSSSLDSMAHLMMNQFNPSREQMPSWRPSVQESSSFSSPSEDVNRPILNIQASQQEQVEASVYVTTLLGKRYFTLDNHTIEQLPQMMVSALGSSNNFNYTKMTDKMSVTVAFPMAMGLPFVFTLKTPTLMMLSGSAQAQSEPDLPSGSPMSLQTINMTADLHLVYSSHTQSQMGFIAPFNNQHYISGVNKNFQVNIPVKAKIGVDLLNRKIFSKLEPLDGSNQQNMIEYSTVPYTAKKNILGMVQNLQKDMQLESNNEKIVHVRSANQIHKTIGQDSTGLAFDFDYYSEQKFLDFAALYNGARKHDPLSAMIYAWAEDSIHFNNITLAFNPHKSTAKYAKFAAAFLDDSDSNNGGNSNKNENDPGAASASMAQAVSTAFNSQERQQQFLSNVAAGIQDSSTMVLDMSAEFQGKSKASFVATFAAATSFTSPKARYLFFSNLESASSRNGQNQVCIAAETLMPSVPLMNFAKALNADPTSYLSSEMYFGEKCSQPSSKVIIKGEMKRSQERHQMMEQMPLAQMCKVQMQEGNSILSTCRNVTMHANCMDQYKFSLQFDKISEFWKNVTYKAYSAMRFVGYQYVSEDLLSHNNPGNTVEVGADFAPDLSSLNVTIKAPMLSAHFSDLRVDRMVQPLLVINPEYSAVQRAAEYIFQSQQFSTCVVDGNQAETFDNKSYPLKLGHCWHIMMRYTPKMGSGISVSDSVQNVSIHVRDASSNNNKEVMIMMGGNSVHLEPSQVTVNNQSMKVQHSLSQVQDNNGQTLVQMYRLPSGALRVFAPQQNMELQYDGSAVKIRAPNSYRSKVRGLCGTFNSQPSNDFTAPANCVMQDPFEFAAMYTVVDPTCQGPSKALRSRAQPSSCFQSRVAFSNVVTNSKEDISEFDIRPRMKYKVTSKKYSSCTDKRTMVVEKEDKLCFSLKAWVECAEDCKPQAFTDKQVDFFCTQHNAVTEHWKDMIHQGKQSDFSKKKATLRLSMKIPESCIPK